MKSTTRGTLAAVITGVAAAVGAAATPAAAAVGTVPVPVPLDGVSQSLGMEVPTAGLEVPLLTPGAPDGPRYVTGHLLPDRTLPQLPVTSTLPGADLRAPVPHLLGDRFDHVGVDAPASDLRTLAPGLNVDAPLTPPNPENFGLPDLKLPEAGLLAPVLQTAAGANLGTGPGL
ncbi:hypothetical protein LK07_11400 [Streptomyces pluripotens]|uniref:ATP-binding protein n=1 Tax=Streptomyces pluripotens TaxID=1355015 RepID=A0A221NX97_9ACTN|nr:MULTISPECIES: hypothetical protein [Streptomyces]ARP70287.1 hypothetical protein LK06_010275 [Streptomyces pluripotens]ASN24544.1 hypothetical protein LK07_11400 [Streptomyces pluripotens]KIE28064.1 hypothetical protein LK08_05180 [Streptomyces sp. MUSC 125]MCH0558388.1 hypothetical protein [Streptomyces sp. MUM 16J]